MVSGDIMKLCDEIREDANCLWEAMSRFIRGINTQDDCDTVMPCYYRLKINYALYFEQRHSKMPEVDEWFVLKVIEAFEDLYTSRVIKTN